MYQEDTGIWSKLLKNHKKFSIFAFFADNISSKEIEMKTLNSDTKPAKRIPATVEVDFRKTYGRSEIQGKLLNISLSGAFLKTTADELSMSDKINLTFKVGSRERNLTAKIVWVNQYGAGVQFYHGNNRDVQIVDDLMYFIEESRQDRRSVLSNIFDKVS